MQIFEGGVLALGSQTLTVNSGGALQLSGGTVVGGTLTGAGQFESFTSAQPSTLDGVTIASGATFNQQNSNGTLVLRNVTVNGTIQGNGYSSTLVFAALGTDNMSNISGYGTIDLADGAANSLALTDGNFTNIPSSTALGMTANYIYVNDGNAGNTVDASAVTGTNAIDVQAGTGATR